MKTEKRILEDINIYDKEKNQIELNLYNHRSHIIII